MDGLAHMTTSLVRPTHWEEPQGSKLKLAPIPAVSGLSRLAAHPFQIELENALPAHPYLAQSVLIVLLLLHCVVRCGGQGRK